MSSTQFIILIVLLAYLATNIIIGLIYSHRQHKHNTLGNEINYFIGGRRINGFILAMTTMATYISVSSFLSGPGAAGMTYGYAQTWIAAIQAPVTFLVLGVLGNKLALVSRRTGAVTIAGYLKARYTSNLLVVICTLLMLIFFIAQMVSQFTGGATLIQSVTGLSYQWSLAIFALTVIIYTAFGGFAAVAITDAIQGIIMCAGTFLFLFFVVKAGGGLTAIDQSLQNNLPGVYDNLFAKYAPGTLLSFWILVGFGTIGLPQTAVRAMSFRNTKSLRQAIWIGALASSLIIIGMHLGGTWAGALKNTVTLPTSDYFIPSIVQRIMPPWLAGLFLAAPMAAVMSTADSLLLLASAALIRDIWKNYFVNDTQDCQEKYTRYFSKASVLITAFLGIGSCLLAIKPPNIIFFLNLYALGGLECTFFWPLVGGLFWKKGTSYAALASSICGALTYLLSHRFIHIWGIHAVVWGLLIGGLVFFVTGWLDSQRHPLSQEILDKCF